MELHELKEKIGPRGQTPVNSSNRRLVRRYLVARGLASQRVQTMPVRRLNELYNDEDALRLEIAEDDHDRTQDRSQGQHTMPLDDPMNARVNGRSGQDTATTTQPAAGNGQDTNAAAQQIAALLTQLTAGGQPVDAEQVRGIVREELEQRPARKIEVQRPEGSAQIENAHYAAERVIRTLSAGVHVWLAGPAGSGKTTLAEQAAEALGLSFYSTGAVTSDFRLVGYTTATGELVRTPFREAFEHGGLFLFDEIDASHPAALVALNQALANGSFAFPDGMVKRHPDFRVVAAANTWGNGATSEYVGRTRIDGASIDRFAFIPLDYDPDVERAMAGQRQGWAQKVQAARQAAEQNGIRHIISPRATEHGARMLEAGMDVAEVAEAVLRKGLDQQSWDKIRDAAGL